MTGLRKQDFKPCVSCGKGMAANRSLDFYRVTIEHHILDRSAIQRIHGEEMMMGGGAHGAMLSSIIGLGGSEELSKSMPPQTCLLCANCAMRVYFAELIEGLNREPEPEDGGE